MAWFKKSDEEYQDLANPAAAGQNLVTEPAYPRAEPREPRVDARFPPATAPDSKTAMRSVGLSGAEESPGANQPTAGARPGEARVGEPRAAEVRAPVAPLAPAKRSSVLGATLRFRGDLTADEDLIVQGSVEGSIVHTQSLTIGPDGSMKGDVHARVIFVDGRVDGDLYAAESVTLRATAKLRGNVFAPRLSISEGAFFQGQIDMQSARALHAVPATALDNQAVDQVLSGT